jgi:carboxyl-terminal processing protease
MMRKLYGVALIMLVCASCRAAAEPGRGPLQPQPHFAAVARQIVGAMQRGHLLQQRFDDALSARAWTNLLTAIDYDRAYFRQEDLARFEPMLYKLDDALKSGDVQFAYDVFAVFRERLNERFVFVTNMLARPIDFSVDESFNWKRKDAVWPASVADQDDLWRRRIKNEYLGFLLAREGDSEKRDAAAAAALTNVAAAATEPASAGNDPAAAIEAAAIKLLARTPEQFVRQRYEQFKIVLDDSDSDWVFQRYMSALTAAYDPHSDYLSPEKREDFEIEMNLSLSGIGATLRPEDGTALIVDLIPGGPAARDTRDIRLRPNDKIIGVGQGDEPIEDILHLPLSKAVLKIRGKKGSRVVLLVVSASDPTGATTRRVDLVRDDVNLQEQAATGRVERITLSDGRERTLGVIALPVFYGSMQPPNTPGYRSCALDVAREIARLNDAKVEGLVLDLRNNGGGMLREAVNLAGLFLREGPVVQVREAWQVQVLTLPNSGAGPAFRKPLVTLVNRTSASASEIVAGALQDYGRAVIVGDSKTHGKGSVQSVLPLNGSKSGSLKLTTANYYRVNGASTQLRGVVPDVVVPSLLDALEIGEDQLTSPLPWTQVPEAVYAPIFDMRAWIPELRARAAERLAANKRYRIYSRLVQHVREMSENTTIPLERQARRAQAAAEREMRKMQEAEEGATRTGRKSQEDDLILREALSILSDLVDVSAASEVPSDPSSNDLRALMLRVFGKE